MEFTGNVEMFAGAARSLWNGFARLDFTLGGRSCILVFPERPTVDKKWVWRAEFFDAFPSVDLALVQKGFYLAYVKASDLYGNPEAVRIMKKFHDELTAAAGLSRRAILFGFSRGGLYAVNYAAAYPEDVSALYLDAPWVNLGGSPNGSGPGIQPLREWEECKALYGLTDETAKNDPRNPLLKAETLAKQGFPLMLVAGDADDVVRPETNGKAFAAAWEKAGGRLSVIIKHGCGHHPHSLSDPSQIRDFLLKYSL